MNFLRPPRGTLDLATLGMRAHTRELPPDEAGNPCHETTGDFTSTVVNRRGDQVAVEDRDPLRALGVAVFSLARLLALDEWKAAATPNLAPGYRTLTSGTRTATRTGFTPWAQRRVEVRYAELIRKPDRPAPPVWTDDRYDPMPPVAPEVVGTWTDWAAQHAVDPDQPGDAFEQWLRLRHRSSRAQSLTNISLAFAREHGLTSENDE